MPQSLECIEYRAASAKGAARRKRGRLDVRLVQASDGAEVEVRGGDSRRPHRIPVSRLIALTIDGQRHPIGSTPEDASAQVRHLLGRRDSAIGMSVTAAAGNTPPVTAQHANGMRQPAPVTPPPLNRQAFMGRGGTTAALVPERAYGCLLVAMVAICALEILVLIVLKSR